MKKLFKLSSARDHTFYLAWPVVEKGTVSSQPQYKPICSLLFLTALITTLITSVATNPLHAQEESQKEEITFAIVGNLGADNSNHTAVSSMIHAWDPDFILTLGNNRGPGASYDSVIGKRYCAFVTATSNGEHCESGAEGETAFYPALGPQDYQETDGFNAYLDYFDLPRTERYYDFVQGPIHFFAINSNPNEPHGNTVNSSQAQWLRQELLRSTSLWQVVYFHHAPYSSGKKGSYQPMQWPFAEWGADVVFASHDRHYERLVRDGVLYFVNGVAQSTASPNSPIKGSQIRFRKHFGAIKGTAKGLNIEFDFSSISGYSDKVSLSWSPDGELRKKIQALLPEPSTGSANNNSADSVSSAIPPVPEVNGSADCVDGGVICLYDEKPGPYHRYANQQWEPGTEARYGELTYVRIDRRIGASVDNLLAGYPNRPKVFCRRPANHLELGEPANGNPFIAWSDFNPYLTEPSDATMVQRNGRHLYWSTVLDYAQQTNTEGLYPVFVLNGSFFTPESAPEGSQWRYGQMQRIDPNRTMIAFSQDGRQAEILWGDGAPVRYGSTKQLKQVSCRQNAAGEFVEVPQPAPGIDLSWIYSAIGGGPVFVLPDPNDLDKQGQPRIKVSLPGTTRATTTTVPFNPLGENFGQESSPYKDQKAFEHRFYLYYAVDNPKSFVCVGASVVLLGIAQEMSGLELGNRLVEIGCHTAMGLDDNSATAFAWRRDFAESPRKPDVFRHIPNAIGVFAKERWWSDAD